MAGCHPAYYGHISKNFKSENLSWTLYFQRLIKKMVNVLNRMKNYVYFYCVTSNGFFDGLFRKFQKKRKPGSNLWIKPPIFSWWGWWQGWAITGYNAQSTSKGPLIWTPWRPTEQFFERFYGRFSGCSPNPGSVMTADIRCAMHFTAKIVAYKGTEEKPGRWNGEAEGITGHFGKCIWGTLLPRDTLGCKGEVKKRKWRALCPPWEHWLWLKVLWQNPVPTLGPIGNFLLKSSGRREWICWWKESRLELIDWTAQKNRNREFRGDDSRCIMDRAILYWACA